MSTSTPPTPNRAGMIVFNYAGNVLALSALTSPHTWVFPKGHIEPREATYETAQREVLEEAGIYALPDMVGPIGTTTFEHAGEQVVIDWWVGRARWRKIQQDPYDEINFRHIRWLPSDLALQVVTFPNLRNLLRKVLCIPEEPDDTQLIFTNVLELDEMLRSKL